jgi:glucan phosphoethanolaminetransferase (alkaline phosphatase superfamily)
MLQLALRFISTMGTVITAASVMVASSISIPFVVKALLSGLILLALILSITDAAYYWRARPKHFALNSKPIKDYMANWLKGTSKNKRFPVLLRT